jgi:hypothetical protein
MSEIGRALRNLNEESSGYFSTQQCLIGAENRFKT